MIRKLLFIMLLFPAIAFSQMSDEETALWKKMIIGFVEKDVIVGKSIDDKCNLVSQSAFISLLKEYPTTTIVTDYILCNNGSPNLFFEIYDGVSFKYVKTSDVSFNEKIDKDNLKVQFATMSPEEKKFLKDNVGNMANLMRQTEHSISVDKKADEMFETLEPFHLAKKQGIGFITYHPTSNYGITGATFKVYNPSPKTIKYIWFTIAGENAVEDLVRLSNGKYYTTVKGIGPVESEAISTWSFDNIWLSDIIEYLRISTIKIQYMDGSVKSLKYNDEMYIGTAAYDEFNKASDDYEDLKNTEIKKSVVINGNEIYTTVDQRAEFPGGINAFRNKISSTLNQENFKNYSGTLKSELSFVVNQDGSISDIKAIGSNSQFNIECEKAVKLITNKWAPAKINGEKVKSVYSLPVTVSF